MKPLWLRLAAGVARAWTFLYTFPLDSEVRNARRAEIASDLWEFQHDNANRGDISSALHVLTRLVFGISDDVAWCVGEWIRRMTSLARIAMLATAVALALFAGWSWVVGSDRRPLSPAAGVRVFVGRPHPPPPAPPDRARGTTPQR
jgi:hypothetical protein